MITGLDSRQIHIWCAFCEAITEPALLERYRQLLTDAERRQEARFHFAQDRHRYLVTRALVRTTLSRYVDIPPESWTFTANAYGRPTVSNPDPPARRISFNLSHTRRLVVLAVADDFTVGVDTEDTLARTAPLEIAERFFAPEEVAALCALPLAEQPERFFRYWTLKESYIKARGMGLSIPLDQFAFDFPSSGGIRIALQPVLQDAADNWCFWQLRIKPGHMIAVCAQRQAEPPQLLVQEIVPLVSSSALASTPLASSVPA